MMVREYVTINEETAKMAKSLMSFDEYQMGSRTAEYRGDVDEEYALTMKRKSFEYSAKWQNRAEHNDYIHAECSKCGFQVENIEAVETGRCSTEYTKVKWKYCPRCGSKMTV